MADTKNADLDTLSGITAPLWPTVGKILGLSRAGAYAAAACGDIPTTRFGGKMLVLLIPLRRKLGINDAPDETTAIAA